MKIKDLKQEHPAIYKRILECQVEQGNVVNDELDLIEEHGNGNFTWSNTRECFHFWCDINNGNFQTFYDKYPQNETKPVPKITKLTKQQIADKFELDVNLIEII